MISVPCPNCKQQIDMDIDLKIGKRVTCQACNMDLVVTWLFPVSLDFLEISENFSETPDESSNQCSQGP